MRKINITSDLSAPKLAMEMEKETGKSVRSSCVQNFFKKVWLCGYRAKKNTFINKKREKDKYLLLNT